jgi:hypothetical protein
MGFALANPQSHDAASFLEIKENPWRTVNLVDWSRNPEYPFYVIDGTSSQGIVSGSPPLKRFFSRNRTDVRIRTQNGRH